MPVLPLPARLVIINIDGLRQDVFHAGLGSGALPNIARLLGNPQAACGLHLDPLSCAPSITFCCQSSIYTGAHPDQHHIAGNQFFDRFGRYNRGHPRFYAFDIGDTLAVDDAVAVFSGPQGLLNQLLSTETPTLYELAAGHGLRSTVVYNMVARGAEHWLRPSLVDIARFTRGGGLLGLSAEAYDGEMLEKALDHLRHHNRPDILTLYFMGLDHHSHQHGPQAQAGYLSRVVDAQIGQLWSELEKLNLINGTLFIIVSDHGQIRVIPDDRHSLRLSFPFDREMGYLFDALDLDVNDKPGEDPSCDAVLACNGGMAHVYLKHRQESWSGAPHFEEDVLRVARAFLLANATGQYAPDLQGALAGVLVRNTAAEGWQASFRALTSNGTQIPLEAWLSSHPEIIVEDAVHRIDHLAGPMSGDILLVSNYADGFYFGNLTTGVHGGLHTDDSRAVLSLGWPSATTESVTAMQDAVHDAVATRCQAEGYRAVSVTDMVTAIKAVWGW